MGNYRKIEMKQTNFELLKKFNVMTRWMIDDTERAMFKAQANLLVAQGLLNYTEILGSFILPDGDSGERFDEFFKRMGPLYENLLKRHNNRGRRANPRGRPHVIYDDLRCGLTHEYAVKRKVFTIYNSNRSLTEAQINGISVRIAGQTILADMGVKHIWLSPRKGAWLFFDPKYWLDFKNAINDYLLEVHNLRNRDIRRNFFRRAREINFLKFIV